MSYSNPDIYTFATGLHDFGTGTDEVTSFQIPGGRKGRILDAVFSCTEACAGTIKPGLLLGTAADTDAYMLWDFGTTADTDSIAASDTSGAIIDADIPENTQVEVTLRSATGSATGQGFVTVTIGVF